jgi:hypothetical protein
MLIFRSEAHVDRWCTIHNVPRGALIQPETLWRLADEWFRNKAQPDWERYTLEQTEALFRRLGLTEPFWTLR